MEQSLVCSSFRSSNLAKYPSWKDKYTGLFLTRSSAGGADSQFILECGSVGKPAWGLWPLLYPTFGFLHLPWGCPVLIHVDSPGQASELCSYPHTQLPFESREVHISVVIWKQAEWGTMDKEFKIACSCRWARGKNVDFRWAHPLTPTQILALWEK